jgi:ribose/xylose/arabinose/galactoside ABC-type transport system permease subunit
MLPSALPGGIAILASVAVLAAILLRTTKLGRHALAVGSNEEAARLCGIDVERTKLAIYVLGVGCAGIASVLQLSYLSMGDPTTARAPSSR